MKGEGREMERGRGREKRGEGGKDREEGGRGRRRGKEDRYEEGRGRGEVQGRGKGGASFLYFQPIVLPRLPLPTCLFPPSPITVIFQTSVLSITIYGLVYSPGARWEPSCFQMDSASAI